MNNQTKQKYNRHVEKLANSMKADQNGNVVVYDLMPEHEQHFLKSLSQNSFFGLINLVRSQFAVGDCLGVQVPMPSTTDTDTRERSPERGYIVPRQRFNCEQINIDSFINYAKLDALADYLDTDFESELNNALDKQTLFSLLMVGFNGTSRSPTSDPTTHKRLKSNAQAKSLTAQLPATGSNIKPLTHSLKKAWQNCKTRIKTARI